MRIFSKTERCQAKQSQACQDAAKSFKQSKTQRNKAERAKTSQNGAEWSHESYKKSKVTQSCVK